MKFYRNLLDIALMAFSRYVDNPAAPTPETYYPDGERA